MPSRLLRKTKEEMLSIASDNVLDISMSPSFSPRGMSRVRIMDYVNGEEACVGFIDMNVENAIALHNELLRTASKWHWSNHA